MKRNTILGFVLILVFAAALAWSQSASLPKRWQEAEQVISRDVDANDVWLADKVGSVSMEIQSPQNQNVLMYQASTSEWINTSTDTLRIAMNLASTASYSSDLALKANIASVTNTGQMNIQGASQVASQTETASITNDLVLHLRLDGARTMTGNLRMGGYWVSNDGGNEGVWVGADGKVGIGTDTPAVGLVTNSSFLVRNGQNIEWGVPYASGGTAMWATTQVAWNIDIDGNGPIPQSVINQSGYWGIATTTPTASFTVEGAMTVTGMPRVECFFNAPGTLVSGAAASYTVAWTEVVDTHGCYSGNVFTCPDALPGLYFMEVSYVMDHIATTTVNGYFQGEIERSAGATTRKGKTMGVCAGGSPTLHISGYFYLSGGQTLTHYVLQNSGTNQTILGDPAAPNTLSHLSIYKVH